MRETKRECLIKIEQIIKARQKTGREVKKVRALVDQRKHGARKMLDMLLKEKRAQGASLQAARGRLRRNFIEIEEAVELNIKLVGRVIDDENNVHMTKICTNRRECHKLRNKLARKLITNGKMTRKSPYKPFLLSDVLT